MKFFEKDYSKITGQYRKFQKGKVVENISSGKGMILSFSGVYVGEIKDNKRSGKGTQFGVWSDNTEEYTVTEGSWSNDMANGKCTYSEINIKDKKKDQIYKGNVKDNMFDGKITITQTCTDGVKDTFTGTAKNGTFETIRTDENGNYVFAESKRNWYLYQEEKESLKNRGVWAWY